MFRKIIAGTAVAGALTFGMAGIAGAATTNTATGTPSAAVCAKVAKVEARIGAWEAKVNARIPKAQNRETQARNAGHTKLADFIANRIAKVQARETKVNGRLATIEAKCGTTGAAGSTVG